MTIPVATTTIRVERPGAGRENYEAALFTVVASHVRAHIGNLSGLERLQGGSAERVTFRLDADPVDLKATDEIVDEVTQERYRVVWSKQRHGLGLDHVEAELRQGTGVAA